MARPCDATSGGRCQRVAQQDLAELGPVLVVRRPGCLAQPVRLGDEARRCWSLSHLGVRPSRQGGR